MSQPAPSLIEQAAATAAAAPAFSFFSTVEEIEQAAGSGGREFSGERLHRDRPETYQAVVAAYANGLSIRQIARALRVSTNTVAAVVEREPKAVETHKQRTISGLRRFVGATIERMLEDLDRMPLQSLPVALGVAVDKLQLLSGEATARVERVEVRPDQVRSFIDSLPVIEGEIIEDDGAGTGVAAGTAGQKGAVLGLPDRVAGSCGADMQSGVSEGLDSVDGEDRATCRTTCEGGLPGDEVVPAPGAEGGGGGAGLMSVSPRVMSPEIQNLAQRADVGDPPAVRVSVSGELPAAGKPLCKRTKKESGPSMKGRISKKKKGGSAC
jgi:hypothetical protein